MIARCTECLLLVDQYARYCFNCGIENPATETLVSKESKHTFSFTLVGALIFATIITAVVAAFTYLEKPNNLWQNIGCAFGTSLILGFVFSFFVASFIESRLQSAAWKRSREAAGTETLRRHEDLAYEKISELVDEQTGIDALVTDDYDVANAEAVNEEIRLAALGSVNTLESHLYQLQIDEISLLRQKSDIYQISQNLNSLTVEEIEDCLAIIDEHMGSSGQTGKPEDPVTDTADAVSEHEFEPVDGEEADVDRDAESIDEDELAYDHDHFHDRINTLQGDLDNRAAGLGQTYSILKDALLRRGRALEDGVVPTSVDTVALAGSKKFASDGAVREFRLLVREHTGLLEDLRLEFDTLNPESKQR